MKTKIEWRLRAVTRYLLTRYETPIVDDDRQFVGSSVQPSGEFESLSLAMRMGEAMAAQDEAHARDGTSIVEFDGLNVPGPKVRAKMICQHVQAHRDSAWQSDRDGGNVQLSAVYENGAEDGGNAAIENRIFSKATPSAMVQMQIENPEAFSRFKPGQVFYVDFIPVPAPGELLPIEDA